MQNSVLVTWIELLSDLESDRSHLQLSVELLIMKIGLLLNILQALLWIYVGCRIYNFNFLFFIKKKSILIPEVNGKYNSGNFNSGILRQLNESDYNIILIVLYLTKLTRHTK